MKCIKHCITAGFHGLWGVDEKPVLNEIIKKGLIENSNVNKTSSENCEQANINKNENMTSRGQSLPSLKYFCPDFHY